MKNRQPRPDRALATSPRTAIYSVTSDRLVFWVLAEAILLTLLLTASGRSATCFNAGVVTDRWGHIVVASNEGLVSPNSHLLEQVRSWPGPSGSKLVFSAQQYALSINGQYLYLLPSYLQGNQVGVLGITRLDLNRGSSTDIAPASTQGAPIAPTLLVAGRNNQLLAAHSDGTILVYSEHPGSPTRVVTRSVPQLRGERFSNFSSSPKGTLYFSLPQRHAVGVLEPNGTYKLISGASTRLDEPEGVAVGSDGRVYVTEPRLKAILVYAETARGDSKPVAELAGPLTSLIAPRAIALDGEDRLYVFDGPAESPSAASAHYIRVFSSFSRGSNFPPQKSYHVSSACWSPAL